MVVFVLLTAGLTEVLSTYLWKSVIISKFTKEHRHVNTRVQCHKSTIYSSHNICVSALHLPFMNEFSNFSLNLDFKPEQEQNNTLNFLTIRLNRCNAGSELQFRFYIYRNPTTARCIIPYVSCHSIDHRLTPIRYLSNRLCTYVLFPQNQEIEIQILSVCLKDRA